MAGCVSGYTPTSNPHPNPNQAETERETEDWDVVERPARPTPDASTDELSHWVRSLARTGSS